MTNTPFTSRRAAIYTDVPDDKWNNWRWQLSNRLNSIEDFENIFPLIASGCYMIQCAIILYTDWSCHDCSLSPVLMIFYIKLSGT